MRYVFGDFLLDSMSQRLLHKGVESVLPRRAHLLLNYLIEQRERVVKRDELIRKVWGRDNVSDHQLAQLIRAARQVLGDDGNTQSMIRTVMGVGYHWVGEVTELGFTPAPTTSAMAPAPAFVGPAPAAIAASAPKNELATRAIRPVALSVALITVAVCFGLLQAGAFSKPSERLPTPAKPPELTLDVGALQRSLVRGQFEQVRQGLTQLPQESIDSPDARLLEIQLDIERGRWRQANRKLVLQQQQAAAASDSIWQAKLGLLHARLLLLSGAPNDQVLARAKELVNQLQSSATPVAPEILAGAFRRRGTGWLINGNLENAALDFAQARDLYLRANDQRAATQASCGLARVWMRQGRLAEALEQVSANARIYAKLNDPISELFARNTALRIQVELLRWQDALASSDRAMQLLQIAPDSERRNRTLQLRAMVLSRLGRLREAESILEEVQAQQLFQTDVEIAESQIVPTLQHLASRRFDQALESASAAFSALPADPHNILFDGRDGALLLWVMAAEKSLSIGAALPTPSPEQNAELQQPESTQARIAKGRWLALRGETRAAQDVLRQALAESRQKNNLYRTLMAGEPLMALLEQSGDAAGAAHVLAGLRVQDPARVDQVRQIMASQDHLGQLAQFDGRR